MTNRRHPKKWNDEELAFLMENYEVYLLSGKIYELASEMDRSRDTIRIKARELGLTKQHRPRKSLAHYAPYRPDWTSKPHPRGMAGKKHTDELKEKMSEISRKNRAIYDSDPDRRDARNKLIMQTKIKNGNYSPARKGTTWKADWREIGGKRKYFRSRWEANYARYLEFLKVHGEIKEWEHECEVFWFEGIKRGCMSYLPDFKVTNNDDSTYFVEVKGWMDDRSKTKINRMRIYHPNVKLLLIQAKWFKDNGRKLKGLIQEWE